jgi:hypothetical protein
MEEQGFQGDQYSVMERSCNTFTEVRLCNSGSTSYVMFLALFAKVTKPETW